MTRYWIFDREDTPQSFPLNLLVSSICELVGSEDCQFLVRRCRGYGAQIHAWDEMLDQADEIMVLADQIEQLSRGTEEWFYDLDARCVAPTTTIGFGLHDSSALFLDAPSDLAEHITARFKKVRRELKETL